MQRWLVILMIGIPRSPALLINSNMHKYVCYCAHIIFLRERQPLWSLCSECWWMLFRLHNLWLSQCSDFSMQYDLSGYRMLRWKHFIEWAKGYSRYCDWCWKIKICETLGVQSTAVIPLRLRMLTTACCVFVITRSPNLAGYTPCHHHEWPREQDQFHTLPLKISTTSVNQVHMDLNFSQKIRFFLPKN